MSRPRKEELLQLTLLYAKSPFSVDSRDKCGTGRQELEDGEVRKSIKFVTVPAMCFEGFMVDVW